MPEEEKSGDFEIVNEGGEEVIKIDYNKRPFYPSIEDNSLCMAEVVDKLIESPNISRIVFLQRRNYNYSYDQTQILLEIATLYNHFIKQKGFLNINTLAINQAAMKYVAGWHANLQYIILNLLKSDPVGAYVEVRRLVREEKIKLSKTEFADYFESAQNYIDILNYIGDLLEKTKLIQIVKSYLAGHVVGSRSIYREVFKPSITPNFMFTRLMASPPMDGEELDVYSIDGNEVSIFKIPGKVRYLYHVLPPEFRLDEDQHELLELAKTVMVEHKPTKEEFIEPERMRKTFFNIARDLIQELAQHRAVKISFDNIENLARILVRYTVGFGLIEVLLADKKIQDVTINSPVGLTPMFIVHQDYGECITNITPSFEDGESWATKLRMLSGRPLDEANPVLDTDLALPGVRARVAVITRPLNPTGIAYSLRRHRDQPWTYPLFISNRMMNPLAAGLMSFLIDGARSILIGGTRSSGKTSFLGSCLVEIMRKYRIITVEDTVELPVDALRKIGYNIQQMKVRSALMVGGTELAADEGIRTSLRMGDSSLIVGEIRSREALALYEAMRVGALANVVAGTVHGASPYAIFDRVVNDLGVPRTSFKATDVIIICNPVRSPDGLHSWKRVLQIAEVRKYWEDDPLREKGFVDLMKYDVKHDALMPTDDLINGESEVIKDVAGNVREWAGNWDAVWDNILLRTKVKETLVNYAIKSGMLNLLEYDFNVNANDMFHSISESVREEIGELNSKRIFFEWEDWLKKQIKRKSFE